MIKISKNFNIKIISGYQIVNEKKTLRLIFRFNNKTQKSIDKFNLNYINDGSNK